MHVSIDPKLCSSIADRFHTVAARKAGLVTLARRGMAGEENREIQLGGEGNRENDGRSNMKTGEEERMKEGQGQLSRQSDVLRFTVDLGSFLAWIFFRSEDNSARR